MPALTDEIKTFIVKGLACYDSPSEVAEAVRAHFGIAITRQHVYAYDPKSTQRMSPRWSALHAATREKFLRDVAAIGVSHKIVRLRRLDRMANECERSDVRMTLRCLQQAAKECGGLYEKRRAASSTKVTLVSGADRAESGQALPSPAGEADAAERGCEQGQGEGDRRRRCGAAAQADALDAGGGGERATESGADEVAGRPISVGGCAGMGDPWINAFDAFHSERDLLDFLRLQIALEAPVKACEAADSAKDVEGRDDVRGSGCCEERGDQQACEDSGRAKHDPPPIAA